MIDQARNPVAFIVARIVERYSHPSRTAYLYLFQLIPGADFQPLPPLLAQIEAAWVDEGSGLSPIEPEQARHRCQATIDQREQGNAPRSSADRRRLMARQVSFSITAPDASGTESIALVDLFSRAIAFTPKSDRRVTETWRPFEGGWFSAYKPPQE